ncbi:MAG: hypothetical protein ACFNVZ_06810, partial [Prevotella melaninogenica]
MLIFLASFRFSLYLYIYERASYGYIKSVASLRHGTAEAIELVVHGDATTSNVVGRQIGDIKLPVGA